MSQLTFPPLSLLRARVTFRMREATQLPPYKGALLRGGFGYAFQRTSCASDCWGHSERCTASLLCPYRAVFEPPHPEGVGHLHDLRDLPRPFVIEPPLDQKRNYHVDDELEFGFILIGQGIDYLPYFLYSFAQFADTGLGRNHARATLERVEVVVPSTPLGIPIYQDGRLLISNDLPLLNLAELPLQAATMAADLQLELRTPLRVKAGGAFINQFDLGAVVQATCWRISTLAAFHGPGPWAYDYRPLVATARSISVEAIDVAWVDWERTSTRGGAQRQMKLGGLIGRVNFRAVPAPIRAVLLAAQLLHLGKACVFGHGWIGIAASPTPPHSPRHR